MEADRHGGLDPFADHVEVTLDQVDSPRGCRRFRKTTPPDFALLDPKRMEEVKNSQRAKEVSSKDLRVRRPHDV